MRKRLSVFFLMLSFTAMAYTNSPDTLELSGPSSAHLSEYATYWVDENGVSLMKDAIAALEDKKFRPWKGQTTLNLGLNPHPLWIHLTVKNVDGEAKTYWWSLYSHADTVVYFRKAEGYWQAVDTARFTEPYDARDVRVRFLASSIHLDPGETAELMMRIRNLRKAQHAVMDITTPGHNLQWEKKFFWIIGFVSGCLVFIVGLSSVLGIITRERPFFLLAFYAAIVNLVILQEELLIVLYPFRTAVEFFVRLPTLGLVITGCGLHYLILRYMVVPKNNRLLKWTDRLNQFGLAYGVAIATLYHVFFYDLNSGQPFFRFLWHFSIGTIFLMLTLQVVLLHNRVQKLWHLIPAMFLGLIMLYFSPAGYFLNYEGILSYYTITYPNHFFWGLCAEFLAFDIIVAWRYRNIFRNNSRLLEEKARHKHDLYLKEIQTQENERERIARDLHDDLGATVSAINLIVTNSYRYDGHLVKMVNRANKDLRFFLSNFSGLSINGQEVFQAVRQRVAEMNEMGRTRFSFNGEGKDASLSREMHVAIYRIVSELISNVLKHAEASRSEIQIIVEEEQVLIIAEDDGRGFDVSRKYRGMGLTNIQERVSVFNGMVHTTSDQRSGTTTIVTLPLVQ